MFFSAVSKSNATACLLLQVPLSTRINSLSSKGSVTATPVSGVAGIHGKARVNCSGDRWAGLGRDFSDDQQDITRGKGMVDAAFQGGWGQGTHAAILSSYDYLSQGQRV